MIRHRLSPVTAALLMVFTSAPPASAAFIAPDIVGTWTGKLQCKELNAGVKEKSTATPTMRISPGGLNFLVELDFGGNIQTYGGLLNPDAKKPDQKADAILIRCGTNDEIGAHPNTMARMSISGKPGKIKASFKGFSFFSDQTSPDPDHGTCKWKFTRTDLVDPNLETSCPGPDLQTGGAK